MAKIAVVQTRQHQGADEFVFGAQLSEGSQRNLDDVLAGVAEAAAAGAEMVVFGEFFCGITPIFDTDNVVAKRLAAQAASHRIVIVGGNMRAVDQTQTSSVWDADGSLLGSQAKMHLYDAEKRWVQAGKEITPVHTRLGPIVISAGLDAVQESVWEQVRRLEPAIWALQTNDLLTGDLLSFIGTLQQWSQGWPGVIALNLMLGRFLGQEYRGGSCIIQGGQVLAGPCAGEPRVLLAEVSLPHRH